MVQSFSMFQMGFAKCQTFRYDKRSQIWNESWVLARNQKGRIAPREQDRRQEFKATADGSHRNKGRRINNSKNISPMKGSSHQMVGTTMPSLIGNKKLNYNSVVSNINISVLSLSKAQTPGRPTKTLLPPPPAPSRLPPGLPPFSALATSENPQFLEFWILLTTVQLCILYWKYGYIWK